MTESGIPVVPEGVSELDVVGVRRGSFQVSGSGDTSGFGGLVSPIVMPAPTERPYGGWFDELADEIELALTDRNLPVSSVIDKVVVDRDEITFFVLAEHIVDFARMLRDEPGLRFEMCLGVNGVHYPEDKGRELHAVYPFLSITHNRRIRVEVTAPDANPHIPSIVGIYPSNDWHERETWDFFGIVFDGHPGLTRIEMPDDWAGHPQRKDYPLGGIPVEYKGATIPAPDNRRAYN
ncbi:MAG: NADH-quinone oxidoreductase subunit C [Actinomycetota bacterium]|nr:NADH-quinone oxidoreductase subunit C [Actinomycetota bacterium]NDH18299.1 NADH-quinone oxidoreductase subunit C [Actinomycetota bacterium]